MKSIKCKECGKFFNPIVKNRICCNRCLDKMLSSNSQPKFNYSIDENLVDSVEQKSVVCKIVKPKFFQRIRWAFRMLSGLDCVLEENKKDKNESST